MKKQITFEIHTMDERPETSCYVHVMSKVGKSITTVSYSKVHDLFNAADHTDREFAEKHAYDEENLLWWSYATENVYNNIIKLLEVK